MLNKSYTLIHVANIRQIVITIFKKSVMHFDHDARVFVLSN